MATPQEVETTVKLLHDNRPQHTFDVIRRTDSGIFAVMHYLSEHANCAVKSKDISNALGISSARTAILLQKLEAKQWIAKEKCKTDARATLVHLTPQGNAFVSRAHEKMHHCAEKLVDEFGLAELQHLFETMNIIKGIMHQSMRGTTEESYD